MLMKDIGIWTHGIASPLDQITQGYMNYGIHKTPVSTGHSQITLQLGQLQPIEVKIKSGEATEMATSFLNTRGINIDIYVLEKDPLVCVGMEGPPDNLVPVYSYEFNYRMQVNGVFVDDNENGNASLMITLSPEDGSVKSFVLPRKAIKLTDMTMDISKIGEEESIDIASEEAKGREILEGTTPVVQNDDIELRYMVIENSRLVPYWKVTVRYCVDDLADEDISDEAKSIGGCFYSVSAVDGQVLFEESF
ncbi:MAG: hypothetical protein SWK76_14395 [Actinomycetota bacterium]|nr:hypothetical protein [Actinomycetota bacterium]